ncbi:MAG: hypothetical protein GJ680_20885 [Alteromonadaceae bacterium]|nr:hypothetical protein [Alteromonadaceae bacterium]
MKYSGSIIRLLLVAFVFVGLSGCASFVSTASKSLADQLQSTISSHNDPEMVKQALPAYMLMMESFIDEKSPDADLLMASAGLYTAYSSVFVDDLERQQRLAQRALDYGKRAICVQESKYCGITEKNYEAVTQLLTSTTKEDVPALFALGTAWGNWLKANSSDFTAIADLPKITAVMQKIVELDETYQDGSAHLYLGVIGTLLPPAVGGKPEVGRAHFEKAISLSEGKNLMVKVTYAQQYARMMFDQELHDKLLNEVLSTDPKQGQFTLTNWMAQEQARALLASGEDYF